MELKKIATWYADNVLRRKMSPSEWKMVGSQIKNLSKTYSYDDIMYALQWTAKHKKMVKFGLVFFTIEEAIAIKNKEIKRQTAEFKLQMEKADEVFSPNTENPSICNYKPKPKWMKKKGGHGS